MSLLDTLFSHNIMIFSLLAVALILVVAVMAMVAPGIIADNRRSAERKKARKAAEQVMKEAETARQAEVTRRKKVIAERAAAQQAKERKALGAGKKTGKGLSPALQAALLADEDEPEAAPAVEAEPAVVAPPAPAPTHPTMSVAALAVSAPGDKPFEFSGSVDLTALIAGSGPLPSAPKAAAPAPAAVPAAAASPEAASAASSAADTVDADPADPILADAASIDAVSSDAADETQSQDEDDTPGPLDEGYKPMLAEPPGAGKLDLQDVLDSVFTEPEGGDRYDVLMTGVEVPSMAELAVLAEQVATQLRGPSPDRRNGQSSKENRRK